jgi:hypothetical protein
MRNSTGKAMAAVLSEPRSVPEFVVDDDGVQKVSDAQAKGTWITTAKYNSIGCA